ncbi:outer membrane beta-barrel protein [Pontibacter roseus]|uniref:outer membrane beta-barrel protein n=1 Tax=Pontibacter roseus TaxID=336989 RepID=UPI00037052F4|nr:outer membrane beta-barrel protein [Pontibacter roseus]
MKTTCTLILLLTCSFAFGQKKFVAGQYVTHQRDTVQVHINDQNWNRSPTIIEVKQDLSSTTTQKLGVADIKSFSLASGDRYEVHAVDKEKAVTKIGSTYVYDSQFSIVRDTVFLRALVKGKVSLYTLNEPDAQERIYIQKEGETPVELVYRAIMKSERGKSGLVKLPVYRGMLTAKMTDCPDLSNKISRVAFKPSALKSLVQDYNKCASGTEGDYVAAEEKLAFNVYALGGVSYTSLDINGHPNKALTEPEFTGMGYTFGTSFMATLPRSHGKYALIGELLYKAYQTEGTFQHVNPLTEQVYTEYTTTFEMSQLAINLLGRYRFLDRGIRPYVSLGFGNNFVLNDNSKQKVYTPSYTTDKNKDGNPMGNATRKHEQALLLGIGGEWKRLQAEVRLENGNGFSAAKGVKTVNNSVGVRLGYRIK